ncbi:hypothetical protein OQA88_4866 [Cercophora sp. LCS_1]
MAPDKYPKYRADVLAKYPDLLQDWSRQGLAHGRHVRFDQEDPVHFSMPILGKLGGGGFGDVYKTFCPYKYHGADRKTYLARKQVSIPNVTMEETREAFQREISILRRLRHQHVIEFVGSYEQVKHAGIALNRAVKDSDFGTPIGDLPTGISVPLNDMAKFLTGGTNPEDRTISPAALTIREVVGETVRRLFAAFGCLAEALRYFSVHKVRHRDLKPQNILMFPSQDFLHDQGIRICDFGLAKGHGQANESYYGTSTVAGTLLYNAPEEVLGEPSGPEADIFSLGCIFLEILCALSIEYVGDLALKVCSRDDLGVKPEKNGMYAQYLNRPDDTGEDAFNDWTVMLRASGESDVQDHLIALIKEMMSKEPRDRPTPTQITTRLAMMDCCPPVEFVCEDFRLLQQIFTNPEGGSGPVDPSRRTYLAVAKRASGILDTPISNPDPTLNVRARPTRATITGYRIQINAAGERIDPVLPTNKRFQEAYTRIRKQKLCRSFYLNNYCRFGDECHFNHAHQATQDDLIALSHIAKRNQVCEFGTKCIDNRCLFGHNCPNSRDGTDTQLLTATANCHSRGSTVKCRYPARLHDLDTRVVSDTGEPEELLRTEDLYS